MAPRIHSQKREEKSPLLQHGSDSNTKGRHGCPDRTQKTGGSGLSTVKKLLLSAALYGNEACCDFEHLYTLPLLQMLGMPLSLVSLTGIVAGPTAVTLIPFLGWLSDQGSNPNRRKMMTLSLSCAILVLGMSCILVANMLHLQAVGDIPLLEDPGNSSSSQDLTSMNFSSTATEMTSTNNSATNSDRTAATTTSSSEVPFKAGLGFLGFVLLDLSFDCLTSSVKSFLLTVTPRCEHTSLLVIGLVVAAAGGVSTAALGVVDFTSLLELSHLEGAALAIQTTVQGAFVIVAVVLGLTITIFTGQRQRKVFLAEGSVLADILIPPADAKEDKTGIVNEFEHSLSYVTFKGAGMDVEQPGLSESTMGHEETGTSETMLPVLPATAENVQSNAVNSDTDTGHSLGYKTESDKDRLVTREVGTMTETETKHEKSTSMTQSFSSSVLRTSYRDRAKTVMASHGSGVHSHKAQLIGREDLVVTKAKVSMEENTNTDAPNTSPKGRRLKTNIALVCASTYFMVGVTVLFTLTSSDFVAKAIYGGEPDAAPGSESLIKYQAGIHAASWGFLVYYSAYVLLSSINSWVLAKIGYKGEVILCHSLLGISLIVLASTSRIEVYYLTAVAAGMQRACFFVVPFATTNDLMHAEAEKSQTDSPSRTGFVMSLVTASMPLGYCTLFPWVGLVMDSTGWVFFPLYLCASCGFVSAAIFGFIKIAK